MKSHNDKIDQIKKQSMLNDSSENQTTNNSTFQFQDNRPEAAAQLQLIQMANSGPQAPMTAQLHAKASGFNSSPVQMMEKEEEEEALQSKSKTAQLEEMPEEELMLKSKTAQLEEMPEEELMLKSKTAQLEEMPEEELMLKSKTAQKKESGNNNASSQSSSNSTGLPDNVKSGIESLSGFSLNDVKVHSNSSKPAQLNAHAYAQGTDIHVAPGQEKHLAHEAWHVVQQKQGRVQPTKQMKGAVNVNDDKALETEADVMGAKAVSQKKMKK